MKRQIKQWLVGLGVWFSLRVREVPGSNPGRAHHFKWRGVQFIFTYTAIKYFSEFGYEVFFTIFLFHFPKGAYVKSKIVYFEQNCKIATFSILEVNNELKITTVLRDRSKWTKNDFKGDKICALVLNFKSKINTEVIDDFTDSKSNKKGKLCRKRKITSSVHVRTSIRRILLIMFKEVWLLKYVVDKNVLLDGLSIMFFFLKFCPLSKRSKNFPFKGRRLRGKKITYKNYFQSKL